MVNHKAIAQGTDKSYAVIAEIKRSGDRAELVVGNVKIFIDELGFESAGGNHDEAKVDDVKPVCIEV